MIALSHPRLIVKWLREVKLWTSDCGLWTMDYGQKINPELKIKTKRYFSRITI